MTAIVDYGVGNLFSLKSSLYFIGVDAVVTGDPDEIVAAERIILPGVGAFQDAAEKLAQNGLDKLISKLALEGKPLLGICLGMQLLFNCSFEHGEFVGLGLISGQVENIQKNVPFGYKIPHIGWNSLRFTEDGKQSPLLKYIDEGDHVYFVHSYAGYNCADSCLADTDYGAPLTAIVGCGKIFGTQFHPEKSGNVGMNILRAFCGMV